MKADTPEMRAMLALIHTWDPLICADLHVTDGADFEPDISIQVEPINQGDPHLKASGEILRRVLDRMVGATRIPTIGVLSGFFSKPTIRNQASC